MRKLLPLVAAVLAACGSSSSSPSPPSYAVSYSAAAFYSGADCPLNGAATTVGASVAILNVTDYTSPTACSSMQTGNVAANGVAAGLLVVRAAFSVSGGPIAAPPITTGTYQFFDLATLAGGSIPPFDIQGNAVFFTGAVATCGSSAGPAASTKVSGGTVTVATVDPVAGTISGSVNATLAGGGSVAGSFTASSACPISPVPDICAAIFDLSLGGLQVTPVCL